MFQSCANVIHAPEELLTIVQKERGQGKKIVFTNGCYDIIHSAHVYLLAEAKALGDILIVALNTDDSVRRQNKGPDRPIVPLESRAFVLAHLRSVDYVTSFDDDTPLSLIEIVQPDVLVKGGDWNVESTVGADIVRKRGGSVHFIPYIEGYSTTSIIKKIREGQ